MIPGNVNQYTLLFNNSNINNEYQSLNNEQNNDTCCDILCFGFIDFIDSIMDICSRIWIINNILDDDGDNDCDCDFDCDL